MKLKFHKQLNYINVQDNKGEFHMKKRKIHLYIDSESLERLTKKSFRTYSGEVNYLISKEVEIQEKESKEDD